MIEPIQAWLYATDWCTEDQSPVRLGKVRKSLEHLERRLKAPPGKHPAAWDFGLTGRYDLVCLPARELKLAMDLYRRVLDRGGAGSHYLQEALLHLIAFTASADGIPFLRGMVDFKPPRDKFASTRRGLAIAGLAFALARQRHAEATEAILELVRHPDRDVRARLLLDLEIVLPEIKGVPSKGIQECLVSVASDDPALLPRFKARAILSKLGCPLPPDDPAGAVDFEVRHCEAPECPRVVRVESGQTLFDLHGVIQKAFDFDDDHLYAFYMNGWPFDLAYELKGLTPIGTELDDRTSRDPVIGTLGLRAGDQIGYLFDYGAEHCFRLVVAAVLPKAPPGSLPKVLKKVGKAPRQYPGW